MVVDMGTIANMACGECSFGNPRHLCTSSAEMSIPMKQPAITCPKCGGEGTVALPEELFVTLRVFRQHSYEELCAADVKDCRGHAGVTQVAINNRIERLARLDLVRFVGKDGQHKLYRAVE